jgi:hypothetical protein
MTQTPPPDFSRRSTEAASGVIDQAQDKLGQTVDHAQHTAGQVTEQAKHQATSQLESQKARAVDSLVTVAQALRQTGQRLREQEQGTVGRYVETAAERVEGLTNHLRSRDVPQLMAETQDLARRRPGMFLTAAVALGFVGGRFLMSSGQRATAQRSFSDTSGSSALYAQSGVYGASSVAPRESVYHSFDPSARPSTGGIAGATGAPAP